MKHPPNIFAVLCCVCGLAARTAATAANLPADWSQEQSFAISTDGLVKISLPVTTLAAARPALEDLRLYDDAGREIPYVIEHSAPVPRVTRPAKSWQVSLNAETTVMTFETAVTRPLSGVTLESPAPNFIKAVNVEGSADRQRWQLLVQDQPIFRQPNGSEQLQIALPVLPAKWLRVTVDDRRSPPVPFTGAEVQADASEPASGAWAPAPITARDENPGETRLTLDLGGASLTVANLKIDTAESLLTRPVRLAVPVVGENSVGEQTIGRGSIYRIAVPGQAPSENLTIPVEMQIPSRELYLLIANGDSQPLPVSGVQFERRPVWLVFLAPQAGVFHLLAGNRQCAAPSYDLSALNLNLDSIATCPIEIPPPTANPEYSAPEILPGLLPKGAPLDVSAWEYRKPVKLSSPGPQQLELDVDVLAHAQPSFADLRLMSGTNQVPFIIQRTSISRTLSPAVTATNDSSMSRWTIALPRAHLPITRLTCHTGTPLFERTLSLYENLTDERGDKYRRDLGSASWRQMPGHVTKELSLTLDNAILGDTLILETENGDNPPLTLDTFTVSYAASRILFKAEPDQALFLYYGNQRAASPNYDLNLVAGELLRADKKTAVASTEESLKKSAWQGTTSPAQGGLVLWGMLALVVVVLLVIISRLLPKIPDQS